MAMKTLRSLASCSVNWMVPCLHSAVMVVKSIVLPPNVYFFASCGSASSTGRGWASAPGGPRQQSFDPQQELLQVEGFGEIVVDAVGKSLDPVIGRPLGGKDQNGEPFVFQADVAQNGEAVQPGQHDVEHDQVRIPLLPHPESLRAAAGDRRFITLQGEIQLQPFGDVRVILDDEDPFLLRLFHGSFPSSLSQGRIRVKTLPLSSPSLSAIILPVVKSGDLLDEIEADSASPHGDAIIAAGPDRTS